MALYLTNDGSHSFISPEFGVLYHSVHGAVQETQCVFIDAGLNHIANNYEGIINILEIGFGTGLNALMTFIEAEKLGLSIRYVTLEKYPLSIDDAQMLNFTTQLNAENCTDTFLQMHSCDWGVEVPLSKNFIFQKLLIDFKEIDFDNQFDLIYFDAFAPESQPDLWGVEILSKMHTSLKHEGVLTTYCAKGIVKRALKSVGFTLESLPGPPGKREMTRAFKK